MSKGERIKLLREKINISQTEMAEKIGVSKQTLYKYENDIITNVPSDKIEAIARITGSTPAFIMGWDETIPQLDDLEQKILEAYRALPDSKKIALYEFVKSLTE